MQKLKINKRFHDLHRPHSEDEAKNLEAAILSEGRVRDAIVIMQGDVIVDGEHRYNIALKHKVPFDVIVKSFASEEDAENWILRNQLARRNLSTGDYRLALGRLYNNEKSGHGGEDRKDCAAAALPVAASVTGLADNSHVAEICPRKPQ